VAWSNHRADRRADLFSLAKIKRSCAVTRPTHLAKSKRRTSKKKANAWQIFSQENRWIG